MRVLRVTAPPAQLALPGPETTDPAGRWWELPEPARTQVLTLLARLITRAVLLELSDAEHSMNGDRDAAGRASDG